MGHKNIQESDHIKSRIRYMETVSRKYDMDCAKLRLAQKLHERIEERLRICYVGVDGDPSSVTNVSLLSEIKHISETFDKDFVDDLTVIITTYAALPHLQAKEKDVTNCSDRQISTGQIFSFCEIPIKVYASESVARLAAFISEEDGFKPILVIGHDEE